MELHGPQPPWREARHQGTDSIHSPAKLRHPGHHRKAREMPLQTRIRLRNGTLGSEVAFRANDRRLDPVKRKLRSQGTEQGAGKFDLAATVARKPPEAKAPWQQHRLEALRKRLAQGCDKTGATLGQQLSAFARRLDQSRQFLATIPGRWQTKTGIVHQRMFAQPRLHLVEACAFLGDFDDAVGTPRDAKARAASFGEIPQDDRAAIHPACPHLQPPVPKDLPVQTIEGLPIARAFGAPSSLGDASRLGGTVDFQKPGMARHGAS